MNFFKENDIDMMLSSAIYQRFSNNRQTGDDKIVQFNQSQSMSNFDYLRSC